MERGQPSPTELRRFYDTSEAYLELVRTPRSMSVPERDRYYDAYVDLVASAAPRGARVLDMGCGTGRTSEALAARGLRVVATDWSDLLIRSGIADRSGIHAAAYLLSDASRLPFADGSFDVVASLDLLEHTLDPAAVLAEASRVLAPDGALVVKCPNLLTPLRPLWYLLRLLRGRRTPVWAPDPIAGLKGVAFNTAMTASKLLLGRPGFLRREPSLTDEGIADDADATYFASAIDVRRWLARHGYRIVPGTALPNDNAAQRLVRRLVPDLASPVAIVARRPGGRERRLGPRPDR